MFPVDFRPFAELGISMLVWYNTTQNSRFTQHGVHLVGMRRFRMWNNVLHYSRGIPQHDAFDRLPTVAIIGGQSPFLL